MNSTERESILFGDVSDLPRLDSKIVRIFVSSTFTDTVYERNYLMEHCYPKLKQVCKDQYNLEFQVVDMRWGIRHEAQDDHMVSAVCLQEIDSCKRLSIGPSFMALVGQKYGYRPFPAVIPASEFEGLKDALRTEGEDVSVLDTWFKCDNNNIPPCYCLQPISSIFQDFTNTENKMLQEDANDKWWKVFSEISTVLRKGANICEQKGNLAVTEKEKYFISVTEDEIQHGIFNAPEAQNSAIVIDRFIVDLKSHVGEKRVKYYMDVDDGKVHKEASKHLDELRNVKLPAVMGNDAIRHSLSWDDVGGLVRSFSSTYLSELSNQVYERLLALIRSGVDRRNLLLKEAILTEVLQHLHLCKQRSDVFQGREDVITIVKRYIQDRESTLPLVVYGESGCGKTSVMAKCANKVHEWLDAKPVAIIRFLGTTVESTGLRHALKSVCQQIAAAFCKDDTTIPDDMSSLLTLFQEILKVATPEKPIVLFLDSLDQLSSHHHAHKLKWLPSHLPPNVKVVVSTLPAMYGILENLEKKILVKKNFLRIDELGEALSIEILKSWLGNSRRCITFEQSEIVKQAFTNCSLPLYTKLLYEETLIWKSYYELSKTQVESDIQTVIHTLFEKLEKEHGFLLVSHALGYLTASQTGISEIELDDLLSLDDEVLNEVFVWWLPPVRRIPPLLWARVKHKLRAYIVDREADGTAVVYWYHRQFIEVAKARYLDTNTKRCQIHSMMADYFLGTWGGGRKKPFSYTQQQIERLNLKEIDGEADRIVSLYPLVLRTNGKGKQSFNIRKMSQLPVHLVESGRVDELRNILLCFDWLRAKLTALSLQDLLSDFRLYLSASGHDKEVEILKSTLNISGWILNDNPENLAFELSARLLSYYDNSIVLKNLVDECDASVRGLPCSFIPAYQLFDGPKDELVHSLETHKQMVVDVHFSCNGKNAFSVGLDKQVILWDVTTGEKLMSFEDQLIRDQKAEIVFNSNGDRFVVESYVDRYIHVYDSETLEKCGEISSTKSDGSFRNDTIASQNYVFFREVVWNIYTGEKVCSLEAILSNKNHGYMSACFTPDERFLILGKLKSVTVVDVSTGETAYEKECDNVASAFVALPCSKKIISGHALDHLIYIWDLQSPALFESPKVIDRCQYFPRVEFVAGNPLCREVSELCVSGDGKKLLANMTRVYLIVWNLETYEAVMLNCNDPDIPNDDERLIYHSCFSADGTMIIAAHGNTVFVWSSIDGTHLNTVTVCELLATGVIPSPTENVFLTFSKDAANVIKIWSLEKNKMATVTPEVERLACHLDIIDAAKDRGIVFVKDYIPLRLADGYSNFDSFGIQQWILHGRHDSDVRAYKKTVLPFGKYGVLKELKTTTDAKFIMLLIQVKQTRYVAVWKTECDSLFFCEHDTCDDLEISPDNTHFLTFSSSGKECRLWSTATEGIVHTFKNCWSPVFLPSGSHILMLQDKSKLTSLNLSSGHVQAVTISKNASKVWPTRGSCVVSEHSDNTGQLMKVCLVDSFSGKICAEVGGPLTNTVLTVSSSGQFFVCQGYNLWSLNDGALVCNLSGSGVAHSDKIKRCCVFTSDEKYLIFTDSHPVDAINVLAVSRGEVVHRVCLHSSSCNLVLLKDHLVLSGLRDGRLAVLDLLFSGEHKENHKHLTQRERNNFVMKHIDSLPVACATAKVLDMLKERVTMLSTISLTDSGKRDSRSCTVL